MAKVHFFYSTMNAGKSTALLQSNYNYLERGMETLLFLPKIDADNNDNKIHSRIGLNAKAYSVDSNFKALIFFDVPPELIKLILFFFKHVKRGFKFDLSDKDKIAFLILIFI